MAHRGLLVSPVLLLVGLAMIILPIPPFMLDALFSFNIAFALVLLTVSIHVRRPLEFSIFPTLLLMATLLRLALNIASTRIVLLRGHEGSAAAGHVIESFGSVMISGNYVVGLLIFVILVIVNFVVITKGGSRISEVTARFTLDAMPGKQMAIDADLNSGTISHEQARSRREDITREADFYGAMDGASKFVRGDAVASLLILFINLLGGLAIGLWQHDMEIVAALHTYALLTTGDGLVAQIPSLLLSTTAAIMVTRVSGANNIHDQIRQEIMSHPKAILTAAGTLAVIGLAPGMPHLAFTGLGLLLFFLAYRSMQKEGERSAATKESPVQSGDDVPGWNSIPLTDPLGLDIGYRVIGLLDSGGDNNLTEMIRDVRRDISQRYGFLLPMVHIRDNLELEPETYTILLHGTEVERFSVKTGQLLAILTDSGTPDLEGTAVQEPGYGLDAFWISAQARDDALRASCTVVSAATVIATHLSRVTEDYIMELFGFEEARGWLENLRRESAKLCDDLVPEKMSLGQLMQVLKGLLQDGIAIGDARRIATTLLEGPDQVDQMACLQRVRKTLRWQIISPLTNTHSGAKKKALTTFTLAAELEKMLLTAREQGRRDKECTDENYPIEPQLALQIQQHIPRVVDEAKKRDVAPVLIVHSHLWPLVSRYSRVATGRELTVLSYQELPDQLAVEVIGELGQGPSGASPEEGQNVTTAARPVDPDA